MASASALRRIELAFDILSEVSTLLGTAPIPIADGILRLLRVVLEMREDVHHCKHEWCRIMLAVAQIERVILAYKGGLEMSGDAMPSYMKNAVGMLLSHVKEVLETYTRYETQGHLGRVFLRHQNRRDVKHCADVMWATVTLFNMRLNVEHASLIQTMQSQISTLTAQTSMLQAMHSQTSLFSGSAGISRSSLDLKATRGNRTLYTLDPNWSGSTLDVILDEANEIQSEAGDEDELQNEGEDSPVLDWLGYLSFVGEA
ncbi:hypothetical protein PENSPDRAFT_738113 [Peniophora sp. CONT]|nr:hypothetical protein PENSPDRAFT_738113 [Peniophora sp. CONT]